MSKDNAGVSPKQVSQNPLVLIKYEPENALALLSGSAQSQLASLRKAVITNPSQLAEASEILEDAETVAEQVETFKATLRERVQEAAARFRSLPGFEDFEVTLTIRKWGLNQLLMDGIRNVRNLRASYLAAEERKRQKAQLDAQAKQEEINRKNAEAAAKSAKAAGADKETVAEIKREVLATPAPIVESKAENVAESLNVSLRYTYSAKITNLKSFLGWALNNDMALNTLANATPDIEKAFRKMAADQKEKFTFPGITFVKTPVDVRR